MLSFIVSEEIMRFLSRFKPPILVLVTLSLVGLTASVLVGVSFLEVIPDAESETRKRRKEMCESSAIAFSLMAQVADSQTMERYLKTIATRSDDVISMAVRQQDGTIVVECGDHETHWQPDSQTDADVTVNLYSEDGLWGQFEAKFENAGDANLLTPYASLDQLIIVSVVCLVAFYMYLRVVLKQLNPSNVIPHRVRDALDTLAEGLLVLDANERIVLANRAFEESTGTCRDGLMGRSIDRLSLVNEDDITDDLTPWRNAIENGIAMRGRLFGINTGDERKLTFSVGVSPIFDERGKSRGALATFEDVTRLEDKKRELAGVVASLQVSSEEIKQQNRELERLATSDSLTGCLNRRSFFGRFDADWKSAQKTGTPLAGMMVDIDFFKSINDDHGHSAGDEVLRQVGRLLMSTVRQTDVVCRYGGEEFAVLFPNTTVEQAAVVAEKVRGAMADLDFESFSITASLGVAEMDNETGSPQDLLDHADKCLYVAKRNGRNRVIRWDDVPEDLEVDESSISRIQHADDDGPEIPYQAVTALISALAYRDESTAAHCRRVADLCVAVGEGLLSVKHCYRLEVAALLHDIGKVGVPDNILLKPGALTDDEWAIMRRHDGIGKEIIRASFASEELTEIVESYQLRFQQDGTSDTSHRDLPLGARILAVADAYDSMTSKSVYRAAKKPVEAVAELRKFAGTQFDPEIVERLAATLRNFPSVRDQATESLPKETALAIGLQIERLTEALDDHDFESLGVVAHRLEQTARKYNVPEIVESAESISRTLGNDSDLYSVLENANKLLDICRRTQRAFVTFHEATTGEVISDAAVEQTIS